MGDSRQVLDSGLVARQGNGGQNNGGQINAILPPPPGVVLEDVEEVSFPHDGEFVPPDPPHGDPPEEQTEPDPAPPPEAEPVHHVHDAGPPRTITTLSDADPPRSTTNTDAGYNTGSRTSYTDISAMMKREKVRLNTFTNWPKDSRAKVQPATLAKAGFYLVGPCDMVRCAFCNKTLAKWAPGDDPMEEHAKYFPDCRFIQGCQVGNVKEEEDAEPLPSVPVSFTSDLEDSQGACGGAASQFTGRPEGTTNDKPVCRRCGRRRVDVMVFPCRHLFCATCTPRPQPGGNPVLCTVDCGREVDGVRYLKKEMDA